jgi:hypothetical protein
MKSLTAIFIIVFGMSLSFWSCQREDLGNLNAIFSDTTQNGAVASMTAKINGVPWSAVSYDVSMQSGTPGEIQITGESQDGQIISFTISSKKAGDYLMSFAFKTAVGAYAPDSVTTSYYTSNATFNTGGVINISNLDTIKRLMSGEFNFIGARSDGSVKTITEGKFTNLDFTNISVNTSFSAKYNGNLWNPDVVNAISTSGKIIITASVTSSGNPSKIILTMPASVARYPYRYGGYALTAPSGTAQYSATYQESGFTLIPYAASPNNSPKTPCTLRITSNDTINKKIAGTFSFYGVNESNLASTGSRITGGVFSLSYQQ